MAAIARSADYFMLALQWGTSFCAIEQCQSKPKLDFTIHGLWPNYFSGPPPQNCAGSPFSASALADIRTPLESSWASLTGPNEDFWAHEWTKHGTCSQPFLGSEHDYFKAALDVRDDVGLLDVLASAGITPDDNKTYDTAAVTTAIKNAFYVTPTLECLTPPPGIDGQQGASLLMEIHLCLVPSTLLLQRCPSSNSQGGMGFFASTDILSSFFSTACGTKIRLPSTVTSAVTALGMAADDSTDTSSSIVIRVGISDTSGDLDMGSSSTSSSGNWSSSSIDEEALPMILMEETVQVMSAGAAADLKGASVAGGNGHTSSPVNVTVKTKGVAVLIEKASGDDKNHKLNVTTTSWSSSSDGKLA